jgi:hypothetical protein
MVVFEVSGNGEKPHKFNCPEGIHEITLGKFIKFKETVDKAKPKTLIEYEALKDETERRKYLDKIEPEEIVNNWTDYYIAFIQYFTGIPDELAVNLEREQISWIYKLISLSILTHQYDENKSQFTHKGETYFYPPAPLSEFTKKKDYMKGTRVIEVIESFQYEKFSAAISTTDWGALPFIIAILCKRKDEQLPLKTDKREHWLVTRKQLFDTLPLSEAFDVAFFLTKQKVISENISPLFSLLRLRKSLTNQNTFGTHTVGSQP